MRAVVLHEFGPPDRLAVEEVPEPHAGPGQVVVAVEVAGVTFVETQVRAGQPPNPALAPPVPVVLGNGVGGTVVANGAGVDGGVVGRRVVTTTGGSGGYAERVAVDADALVDVPVGMDLADAVALLADGRTATGLMDLAEIRPGENVLVEAAAGGVGSVLVQLVVHTGATVVAAAGGSRKVTLAAELGATVALDYSEPGWVDRVTDQFGALDVVFDGVGGEIGLAAFGLLAEHGRFLPFGMASGAFTRIPEDGVERRHLSVVRSGPKGLQEMNELTRRALAAASAGEVRPVIGQTFPLERASEAHAAIAARATVGKTLLLVDPTGAKNEAPRKLLPPVSCETAFGCLLGTPPGTYTPRQWAGSPAGWVWYYGKYQRSRVLSDAIGGCHG